MKLFHLADLHLGKRLNELSLIPDQKYILQQILQLIQIHQPQAVLIAGDVYDKAMPSAEAVELFDSFLSELKTLAVSVFVIAGNHDSGVRLSFGSNIFSKQGLYIAGHFTGKIQPIDIDGVHFWLLPYLRPGEARHYLGRDNIETYQQAVQAVLSEADVDTGEINIILTHQFVTAQGSDPMLSQSEVSAVGGLDNVSAVLYDLFDYVACGHLHIPQKAGRDTVRYCGSPLKYSFSEAYREKSVTMVDIAAKNKIEITPLPLTPIRDMRIITGPFKEILANAEASEDYIKVILTDKICAIGPDPMAALRKVYPNILSLSFDSGETDEKIWEAAVPKGRDPLDMFEEFYRMRTGIDMTDAQTKLVKEALDHETG